jgi:hypothetical protein
MTKTNRSRRKTPRGRGFKKENLDESVIYLKKKETFFIAYFNDKYNPNISGFGSFS